MSVSLAIVAQTVRSPAKTQMADLQTGKINWNSEKERERGRVGDKNIKKMVIQ